VEVADGPLNEVVRATQYLPSLIISQGTCKQGSHAVLKVSNFRSFSYITYWKSVEIQISKQNFTEGKVLHYLCSVMQCVKLSFMT